ncbi:MAG: hypothetical protein WCP96_06710 [Methylococcaceae bacterium]
MSQNNLNGLFFPAVAGLFFFMKRPKIEEVEEVKTDYPVYSRDVSGLTGVAKYLDHQDYLACRKAQEQESLEPAKLVSGVARYLESRSQFPTSGVSKYLLRQAIAEKQKKQSSGELEVTGVEKYLKNKKEAPGLSGVAKYLKHQAGLPQPSKVAKYLARQTALSASQIKHAEVEVSGVAKYLQRQESLPQPSRVAKYLAKQAALAALSVKQVKQQVGPTGVAKYLQDQAGLPQISRVAKYMVRQALVEKQKPVVTETGVEKYMRHQG